MLLTRSLKARPEPMFDISEYQVTMLSTNFTHFISHSGCPCLNILLVFFFLVCYHHKEVSKFCLNVIPGLNLTRYVFSKCTLNKVRCNSHITVSEKASFYTIPIHYSYPKPFFINQIK